MGRRGRWRWMLRRRGLCGRECGALQSLLGVRKGVGECLRDREELDGREGGNLLDRACWHLHLGLRNDVDGRGV
jgi:hypothetical protein